MSSLLLGISTFWLGWAGLGLALEGDSQNHCGMEAMPWALHLVGTCVYTTNGGQAWAGLQEGATQLGLGLSGSPSTGDRRHATKIPDRGKGAQQEPPGAGEVTGRSLQARGHRRAPWAGPSASRERRAGPQGLCIFNPFVSVGPTERGD